MKRRATNNKRRKEDILRLRAEGKSMRAISKELGCSKSVISYHCGNGNEKKRVLRNSKKTPPICKKVTSFKSRCSRKNFQPLSRKLKTFKRKGHGRNRTSLIVHNISKNYNCKEVLEKIGSNPVCYLTGKKINLNKPETYHLDHITPTSKGGTNDLNNLNICIKEANYAKADLSVDELYTLCENILAWRDKNLK